MQPSASYATSLASVMYFVCAQLDTVRSKAGVLAIVDELEKITPLLEKVRNRFDVISHSSIETTT